MTGRDYLHLDDSDDEQLEIELVDLTSEDDDARGPVDVYQTTRDRPDLTFSTVRAATTPTQLHDELRLCRLVDGTIIRVGDMVELQMPQHRKVDAWSSGDFLRISKMTKEHQTGNVSIQGHRFMREKYIISKASDGRGPRVNEVVQHLVVRQDDNRPAVVQALERISLAQVVRKQTIILTDKSYPMLGFWGQPPHTYAHLRGASRAEVRTHIFRKGPLVCRRVRTSIISPNGKTYGGIYSYFKEYDTTKVSCQPHSLSQPIGTYPFSRSRRRSPLLEEVTKSQFERRAIPIEYIFFDAYCGAGGAARGAANAGLKVVAGLDNDLLAMQAWELNNPHGLPICIDSLAFLKNDIWKMVGRMDILNISFPCQVYSSAHVRKGKNDEINVEQLDRIKPLIEKLKPRVVILENTSGLANIGKNRKFFNKVLDDVSTAGSGYNLRFTIVNMADYGLPQERKRLIVIAARKNHPLPPFPKPTHGPHGSGLKPYVTIGDALTIIEQAGQRADGDAYHTPHKRVSRSKMLYDPFTKFVDCIVTGGATTRHWGGDKFSPRELALLQSLPYEHHLTGSHARATKQVGNMFPPVYAAAVYRICVQILEAFDHGFITADDDIDDLNVTLIEKDIDIPKTPATPTSSVDSIGPPSQSPFKYLAQPSLSDANPPSYSSAFARRILVERSSGQGVTPERVPHDMQDNKVTEEFIPSRRERVRKRTATNDREQAFWVKYHGRTIELSDSEAEYI